MTWIRENKFLAIFVAVMVVGVGVLTFLLLAAQTRFAEVSETYDGQEQELKRLQSLTPYPDAENLQRLTARKEEFNQAVTQFESAVAALQMESEPLTPEQFQDRLREAVSRITELAQKAKITLPADFYLGFDRYQAAPPATSAVTELGWQLKTIEFVVAQITGSGISSIDAIERTPLPSEGGAPAPAADSKKPASATKSEDPLRRLPFTVSFTGDQGGLRRVLNAITTAEQQFYVLRSLRVENEQQLGPARGAAVPGAAVPGAAGGIPDLAPLPVQEGDLTADPTAPSAPAAPGLSYVLGTEKVKATLIIDVIDFPETQAPKTE